MGRRLFLWKRTHYACFMNDVTITITPEEFSRLLKLTYLGEFMANMDLPAESLDPERRALAELRSKMFYFADANGKQHYSYRDEATGQWFASRGLEEDADIRRIVREYDDHVFWEELGGRLASRDLMAEYGKDTIENMEDEHYASAQDALLAYYDREFDAHGTDRLYVKD